MRSYRRPLAFLHFVLALTLLGVSTAPSADQTAPAPSPPLGTLLKTGTELHYAMNGKDGPPWQVQMDEYTAHLQSLRREFPPWNGNPAAGLRVRLISTLPVRSFNNSETFLAVFVH